MATMPSEPIDTDGHGGRRQQHRRRPAGEVASGRRCCSVRYPIRTSHTGTATAINTHIAIR
ncbi:hypothetical protein, partial [Streptomyces ipomoeae]|uniref:hypothetical protein n=1 Tax=Streptomyces ipomoeae TaxID=103232 RepID=UPI0029AF5FC3